MSGEVAGGDGPVRVHMLKSDVEMEEQKRHAEQAEHEGLDPHHHGEAGHSHQPVAATRHHERCANIKQDTLYAIALAVCVFLVVVLGASILGALAHQQGWWIFAPNNTTNATFTNGTNIPAAFAPVGNGTLPVNNSGPAAGADPNCGDCAGWAQRMMGGIGGLATVCGSALQPNGRATPACCGNLTQIFGGQQCTQFLISQLPTDQQNLVPGIAAQCNMQLPPACPGTIVATGTPMPTSAITSAAPSDSTTTAAPGSTTTASPAGTATNVPAGDSTSTTATPGGTATNVPSGSDEPTAQPQDTTSAATTTTTAPP